MTTSKTFLVNTHLALGSFLLPVMFMFAVTGVLYTFKITGSYNTKTEVVTLAQPLAPDLSEATVVAENILKERGLEFPTGTASIKKVGTSWQFEWSGSRMDFILDATANPLEMRASFKNTSWHRFFVQLHKAKGGLAFKLLAVVLGIGLVLMLISGWFMAQGNPKLESLRMISTAAGIAVFILAAIIS
jgi:uncharacterized iron-regulated membrane protein